MVIEDADLEKAARAAVRSRMANAGQSCSAAKRLIVMESVAEAFTEKFVGVINSLRIGDPMDKAINLGPVPKKEFMGTLGKQLNDALKKGAGVHQVSEPPNRGYFFQPVVLTELTAEMLVLKEEVFRPISPRDHGAGANRI